MLNNAVDFKLPLLTGKIVNGVVEDNNDPLKLGRLRVRVDNIHPSDMLTDQLPWVMSLNFYSSVNLQGNVNIPDIGSTCWVVYPSDDLYSGIYIGCLPNISDELAQNYPFSYGFIDRSGSLFIADTDNDCYKIYHVSGSIINLDSKGNLRIQVANNKANPNASSQNDNPVPFSIEVIGNVDIKTTDSFNVQCKSFNVSASDSVNINGNTITTNSNSLTTTCSTKTTTCSAYSISASYISAMSQQSITLNSGGTFTYGGQTVTLNGLPFGPTVVTDTNLQAVTTWAFNCFGQAIVSTPPPSTPPTVTVNPPTVNSVQPVQITPPPARQRQQGTIQSQQSEALL